VGGSAFTIITWTKYSVSGPARRDCGACFADVDPNPVRVAVAETPENSDCTSTQRRIRTQQGASELSADGENAEPDTAPAPTQPPELYPFIGGVRDGVPEGLPLHLAATST